LFPETVVNLGGPFQGLKLNAGGAFAAYFVTLLASVFAVNTVNERIHELDKSYWHLSATITVVDERGKTAVLPQTGVTVSFKDPSTLDVIGDQLTAMVPRQEGRWPEVRIEVPGVGGQTFNLNQDQINFRAEDSDHSLRVLEPLVIRRPPTVGFGSLPSDTDPALGPAQTPSAGQHP
jgi:hypothetical protein